MAKGKQTCKILKEIRKQIAAENDIKLVVEECTYQGDCLGTCPRCEAEVRYLERELEKRQRLGKAAVFAGMSLGTLFAATGCSHIIQPLAGMPEDAFKGTEVVNTDTVPEKPLPGEVTADPQIIETPPDTITDVLMGIFPMYRAVYSFDAESYQSLLKDLFVFPKMEHLSVVSGEIEYEHAKPGKACESLEELAEAAHEFRAPYCVDGEQDMLMALSLQSKVDVSRYKGEMEIAFTVDKTGTLSDIVIQKSIDKALDEAVVSVFEGMVWHPGIYEMKDGMAMPFDCRCVQKIHFPIK